MSGQYGNLDRKQEEALIQLKKNVKDVLQPRHDDRYLLRWLRARKFDARKAEHMVRNSLEWRARVRADTILDEYDPAAVLTKYFPGGFFGYGKNGNPIFVNPFGTMDVKGLTHSLKKSELVRHQIYLGETAAKLCRQQSKKLGKHIETFIVLFDLADYGWKHLSKTALEYQRSMLQIFEDNYPETLEMSLILNAPAAFYITYKLLSPLLSDDTKRKIKILGHNYIDEVTKYVDRDQIPAIYNGTAQAPPGDPYCSQYICYGGEVPRDLYSGVDLMDRDSWTAVNIKRGSSLQLDYNVNLPGSMLRWQFSTDHHDIGFGVYRRTLNTRQSAEEMERVVMTERVNSHLVPEEGCVVCENAGIYVLRFDNTYSWSKTKNLYYSIEMLEPDASIAADSGIACLGEVDSFTLDNKSDEFEYVTSPITPLRDNLTLMPEKRSESFEFL